MTRMTTADCYMVKNYIEKTIKTVIVFTIMKKTLGSDVTRMLVSQFF